MRFATADMTAGYAPEAPDEGTYQFAGVLLVSLFPALFWTALLAAGGSALGHAPSVLTLVTVGTAIAVFLAAATRALFAKSWEKNLPAFS